MLFWFLVAVGIALFLYAIGWTIAFVVLMKERDRKFGGPWNWDMAPMWAGVALAWPYVVYLLLSRPDPIHRSRK